MQEALGSAEERRMAARGEYNRVRVVASGRVCDNSGRAADDRVRFDVDIEAVRPQTCRDLANVVVTLQLV